MLVYFKHKKLGKILNDKKAILRQYGTGNGNKIMQRLAELDAADNLLQVFENKSANCHQRHGQGKGQFSIDVKQPKRLVFEIADEPIPRLADGGIDRSRVTKIRIIAVDDPH